MAASPTAGYASPGCPTADQLGAQLISALAEADDREPEPEPEPEPGPRTKQWATATGLAGADKDVLVDVMAAVLTGANSVS
ncbi:hypothetical protein [Pseudonocardia nigra]|uniref:hypothetical protein n=1 Tax=Pseudonocardia nigra TaxID=1921578 RepID=UPI001C5D1EE3|nr:hypothetical protein [Pseudonocardia nigra]